MEIKDPENKIGEFLEKIPIAENELEEDNLFKPMNEYKRKTYGPIRIYFMKKGGLFDYNLWYTLTHPFNIISGCWQEFIFAWQRVFRGWDEHQTWSIDYAYSKILGELILHFKKVNNGVPTSVIERVLGGNYEFGKETQEELQEARQLWNDILDEMAEGFLYYAEERYAWDYEDYNKHEKLLSEKINRSLELFSKHFRDLWW